jgi:hypothetical protein
MRQAELTWDLQVVLRPATRKPAAQGVQTMVRLLDAEQEQLAFHAIVPHGSVLKCVSELLMRCAPHVPVCVDASGMSFVACDPTSGRLIHVVLAADDFLEFRFLRQHPLRCTLESSSLHAVFHQLRPGPRTASRARACVPTPGCGRAVRHIHRPVRLAGRLTQVTETVRPFEQFRPPGTTPGNSTTRSTPPSASTTRYRPRNTSSPRVT